MRVSQVLRQLPTKMAAATQQPTRTAARKFFNDCKQVYWEKLTPCQKTLLGTSVTIGVFGGATYINQLSKNANDLKKAFEQSKEFIKTLSSVNQTVSQIQQSIIPSQKTYVDRQRIPFLEKAEKSIQIMTITGRKTFSGDCFNTLKSALKSGKKVEVLLLDPNAVDVRLHPNFGSLVRTSIENARLLKKEFPDLLKVRLYMDYPPFTSDAIDIHIRDGGELILMPTTNHEAWSSVGSIKVLGRGQGSPAEYSFLSSYLNFVQENAWKNSVDAFEDAKKTE